MFYCHYYFILDQKKYYKFRYKEYFISLTSSTMNDLRMMENLVTQHIYLHVAALAVNVDFVFGLQTVLRFTGLL